MNLTALITTFGVMALPLGVYLLVEVDDRLFGISFFIVGLIMLVFAMYRVWLDEKEEKDRRNKRDEEWIQKYTQSRIGSKWKRIRITPPKPEITPRRGRLPK